MSKLKDDYICGTCKRYDSDINYCPLRGTVYESDTCDDWADDNEPTEEESESQRTEAAEKENHRKEVEGDDILKGRNDIKRIEINIDEYWLGDNYDTKFKVEYNIGGKG